MKVCEIAEIIEISIGNVFFILHQNLTNRLKMGLTKTRQMLQRKDIIESFEYDCGKQTAKRINEICPPRCSQVSQANI